MAIMNAIHLLLVDLALLLRLPDHDVPAVGARNGPVDKDHVIRLIDADDLQVANGDPLVSPSPRHLLSFFDLAAVSAVGAVTADAASRPVMALHAVTGP